MFSRLALVVVSVLVFASNGWAQEARREPTLTVLGKGSYETTPELARFSATVSTDGRTLEDAAKSHEERATRASKVVKDLATAGLEVEKCNFSLAERRVQRSTTASTAGVLGQHTETVVDGYVAKTTYLLKATSLDNLNQIVTKLAETGLFQVDRVRFHVLNERAALNEARRSAMLDAREQAQAYANPVDLELRQILAITDGEAQPVDGYADLPLRRAVGPYSVQIVPPATLEFTASVNVTWQIVPRKSP